ncbi:MAG: hypothetical protein HIU92_04530 [Proteobacteria bacterium]|nr:hypothetical protein [Pseudomonadota bacterium]
MPRTFALAFCLFLSAAGGAAAQESPVDSGPMGTPITPAQIGAWIFAPAISKTEAERDARAQGFGHISRMHRDDYGNWIGDSGKGGLIVFPDGRAYGR